MAILSPTKKFNWLLLPILLLSFALQAQSATKTIDKSFSAKAEVHFQQERGPLTVLPSTDGKIRLLTEMSVEADSKADADLFLSKLETDFEELGTRIKMRLGLVGVKSWNQNNNSSRVTFKDGTKIRNIRNFKLTSRLYLPKTELVWLKTRFEDIEIDEAVQLENLELDLHNANVRGGNIGGDLKLALRFGKVRLGNIGGSVSGNLHNAKVYLDDVGAVVLESRFSQVELKNIKSLDLESHNDRYEIGAITEMLDIDERFGTFIMGKTADGDINSHNGTYEIESGKKYTFNSRFANVEFQQLNELVLRDNHNCDYEIKELKKVRGQGRFTNVDADRLTGSADLELFNGKLFIEDLGAGFTGLEVEGSFFELHTRAPAAAYRVFAELNFGTADVPDELVAVKSHKEHSKIEMEYKSANSTAESPAIRVKGQNGKLKIH